MKRANGTGNVVKLKGKRRNSWAVRVSIINPDTGGKIQKYIGYAATKKEAIEILSKHIVNPKNLDLEKLSFRDVFERWKEHEYPALSAARKRVYDRMYEKCSALHDKIFKDIRHSNFSTILDHETHTNNIEIKNLFSKMSNYAMINDLIEKDYSKFIVNRKKREKVVERKVYTEHEIKILWNNLYRYKEIDSILVMIYSGLRIGELLNLKKHNIDLVNRTISGAGIKTEAGKNRVVPIHSKIYPLIEDRYNNAGVNDYLFNMQGDSYATRHQYFKRTLDKMVELGLEKHTAHDCRHTFATRLNDANANSTAIKNIIGHSTFEITEKIYTHKDVEILRKEIEKLN